MEQSPPSEANSQMQVNKFPAFCEKRNLTCSQGVATPKPRNRSKFQTMRNISYLTLSLHEKISDVRSFLKLEYHPLWACRDCYYIHACSPHLQAALAEVSLTALVGDSLYMIILKNWTPDLINICTVKLSHCLRTTQ